MTTYLQNAGQSLIPALATSSQLEQQLTAQLQPTRLEVVDDKGVAHLIDTGDIVHLRTT